MNTIQTLTPVPPLRMSTALAIGGIVFLAIVASQDPAVRHTYARLTQDQALSQKLINTAKALLG